MTILGVLIDLPYGAERSYNGLRLAGARSKRDGVEVRLCTPAAARRARGIIRRALAHGVRWGWLRHTPALDASPRRAPLQMLPPSSPAGEHGPPGRPGHCGGGPTSRIELAVA